MTTHRDIEARFDDYLAGSLPASDSRQVETHLEGCPECRTELGRLRDLLEEASALPTELDPSQDLWSRVEARIGTVEAEADVVARRTEPGVGSPGHGLLGTGSPPGARPGGARSWWSRARNYRVQWAFAGGLATAAAIAAIVLRSPPEVTSPQAGLEVPTRERSDGAGESDRAIESRNFVSSLVRALEVQCMGAGKELSASVDRSESPFSAEVTATLEADVGLLDVAIAETRSALEENPEDPELLQMLTSRYQRKLSLLHQAIRLAGEAQSV